MNHGRVVHEGVVLGEETCSADFVLGVIFELSSVPNVDRVARDVGLVVLKQVACDHYRGILLDKLELVLLLEIGPVYGDRPSSDSNVVPELVLVDYHGACVLRDVYRRISLQLVKRLARLLNVRLKVLGKEPVLQAGAYVHLAML